MSGADNNTDVDLEPHKSVISTLSERKRQHDENEVHLLTAPMRQADEEALNVGTADKSNVEQGSYTASGVPVFQDGLEFKDEDPFLVTWENDNDPKNPRNWSISSKIMITFLTSLNAFMPSFSSSALSPAMPAVAMRFHFADNETLAALCVSIFLLPWAFIPLIASPLSEIYGRKKLLIASLWVLFAFNIGCCFAQTKEQLIVCRFFAGVGGASPLSIGAGCLGDCFDNNLRNKAIGIFAIGLIMAPVVSPIISGFVVENKDWRWVLKILVILNGFVLVLNHLFLRESYAPTLLQYKKRKLIKNDPENKKKYKTVYDLTDSHLSVKQNLLLNAIRPLYLLFYHPMVIGLGVFLSFINGFLYLMIVIFPDVWAYKYGYSIGISGLMFVTMGIGFILGIAFWTPLIDYTVNRSIKNNNGLFKPEFRLELLIWGGIFGPVSLLVFGWTVEKHIHWIVPSIFAAIFAFATVNVFQIVNNYLIDMNPRYSASAVAAATVFRSLFGFVFPLFAPKMYSSLKYSWGNTLFFFIGIVLGIPYPLFAYFRGESLREWGNRRIESLNKSWYERITKGNEGEISDTNASAPTSAGLKGYASLSNSEDEKDHPKNDTTAQNTAANAGSRDVVSSEDPKGPEIHENHEKMDALETTKPAPDDSETDKAS